LQTVCLDRAVWDLCDIKRAVKIHLAAAIRAAAGQIQAAQKEDPADQAVVLLRWR